MPLNLPFQPLSGSRTSNLIEESLVGVATPFTWQWAGKPEAAATITALEIFAWGRLRVARLSHERAAEAAVEVSAMAAKNAPMAARRP
jgi:hypothetical protein